MPDGEELNTKWGGQYGLLLTHKLMARSDFTKDWFHRHHFTQTTRLDLSEKGEGVVHPQGSPHKPPPEFEPYLKRLVTPKYTLADVTSFFSVVHHYFMATSSFMAPPFMPSGAALYGVGSLFNLSCKPNTLSIARPSDMTVVATRPIKAGEEITISYKACLHMPNFYHGHVLSLRALFNGACLCGHSSCLFKSASPVHEETTISDDLVAAWKYVVSGMESLLLLWHHLMCLLLWWWTQTRRMTTTLKKRCSTCKWSNLIRCGWGGPPPPRPTN
jgi:hypothetical protein